MTDEIEEAIARVQRKDRAAFSILVERYQLRLRVFASSIVASRAMVDEIVQTTFVFAYRNIGRYEPGTNFYGWLRAICRNFALEELRREVREHKKRAQYFEFVAGAETLEAESRATEDRTEHLRNCVARLGEKARTLMERRYTRDEPIRSIAATLNRSASAVKVALFRIREQLRECVEEQLRAEEVAHEGC